MGTARQLSESLGRLRQYAEGAGRDSSDIGIGYSAVWLDDLQVHALPGGESRAFAGTPGQVASSIRTFEQLGVRNLMMGFQGRTLAEIIERMQRFMEEVARLV